MSLTELVDVLDALLKGPSGLLEVGFAFFSLPLAIFGDLGILAWVCMNRVAISIGFLLTFFCNFMVDLLFLFLCVSKG